MEPSDRALVTAVAGGDGKALRVLFERHAGLLSVRLWRRCRDSDLVEEVVQDTFLGVWRGAGSYGGTGPVAAWLWGIAIRTLASRLRRPDRTVAVPAVPESKETSGWEAQLVEQLDLATALEKLTPELQVTFQAVAIDRLTMGEAAAVLGVPEGTVKSRMHRARVALREELR